MKTEGYEGAVKPVCKRAAGKNGAGDFKNCLIRKP